MPTEREYLQKLKEFDREWKDTEPAQEGVFDPLPPGSYEAILIDASLTESSTGTVGLNCQFEVTKGDHEGRYLFHTFWVTGKNLPYVKRDMGVLGYSPASAADLVNAKRHLMNKKAVLSVGQEEYEGKTHNKVRSFSRLDSETQQREKEDDEYQF